jgi:hypothetical protein
MPDSSDENVIDTFKALPQEMQEFLNNVSKNPPPGQEIFRGVVAGDCPVCGSFNTLDGGETPLEDPTLGICLDCCTIHCLDCGELLRGGQTACPHRKVCDECRAARGKACRIPVWNCSVIDDWKTDLKKP